MQHYKYHKFKLEFYSLSPLSIPCRLYVVGNFYLKLAIYNDSSVLKNRREGSNATQMGLKRDSNLSLMTSWNWTTALTVHRTNIKKYTLYTFFFIIIFERLCVVIVKLFTVLFVITVYALSSLIHSRVDPSLTIFYLSSINFYYSEKKKNYYKANNIILLK